MNYLLSKPTFQSFNRTLIRKNLN